MKIMYRFFITVILLAGILCLYDVYIISGWMKKRMLEKFVVHIVLKDDIDVEELKKNISLHTKKLKIIEITYITKEQIFEEIKNKEEIGLVLNVLKENPFSDMLRIKFGNFVGNEFDGLVKLLSTSMFSKEVIFDYNLKTYLQRIEYLKIIYDKVFVLIMFFCIMFILTYVVSISNLLMLYNINTFIFTILYFVVILLNTKIVNFLTSGKILVLNFVNIVIHAIIYCVCLLLNTMHHSEVYREKQEN